MTDGRPEQEQQPRLAHDGNGLMPSPIKVQGGYQAPTGGGKPSTPTTGSGVTTRPALPTGSK